MFRPLLKDAPVVNDMPLTMPRNEPDEASLPFAERFKYMICTSSLLASTLSISSYDATAALTSTPGPHSTPLVLRESFVSEPVSTRCERRMAGHITEDTRNEILAGNASIQHVSGVRFTRIGQAVFRSSLLAVALLALPSSSMRAWTSSALLLASVVWGTVAVAGVRIVDTIQYEVTHTPTGDYRLKSFDDALINEDTGVFLNHQKQARLVDASCASAMHLIKSAKRFDVECNKAISAVQEVELVSRGYKLTHPMPPISRIEAAARPGTASQSTPLRTSKGSWHASGTSPSQRNSLLSINRSSSLNSRTRPTSLTAAVNSAMRLPQPGSLSAGHSPYPPQLHSQGEAQQLRMLPLRKALVSTFEEAIYALRTAMEQLQPLLDTKEWALLREMYDLDEGCEIQVDEHSTSTDSATQSSWASRPVPVNESLRSSTPTTVDDPSSVPNTPQTRSLSLLEGRAVSSASTRKRDSQFSLEHWSQVLNSPARSAGSRLSYVSDKVPLTSGSSIHPNQSAASKRFSYISSGSGSSPLQQRAAAVGSASRPLSTQKLSVGAQGSLEDQLSTLLSAPNLTTGRPPSRESEVVDIQRLVSLKRKFEEAHRLRRRLLCCLLALDFSLRCNVTIAVPPAVRQATAYWRRIDQIMRQLSTTMSGLAKETRTEVCRQMGPDSSDAAGKRESEAQVESHPVKSAEAKLSGESDATGKYSDMADQMQAMGRTLRSVQVKLRACSETLQLPQEIPLLHGENTSLRETTTQAYTPLQDPATDVPESERIFEAIREDLLALSAEWESGLKIMRARRLGQPHAKGDADDSDSGSPQGQTSKTVMDSPQEAEEDAMRQWIQSRSRAVDASSDSDGVSEGDISSAVERQLAAWSLRSSGGMPGNQANKTGDDELSALLLRSTSPQHLPPPGLEKVYEAEVSKGNGTRGGTDGSKLTREERIRQVREQRAAAVERSDSRLRGNSRDASQGMLAELQTVMHSRKSSLNNGLPRQVESSSLSHVDKQQMPSNWNRTHSKASPPASTESAAHRTSTLSAAVRPPRSRERQGAAVAASSPSPSPTKSLTALLPAPTSSYSPDDMPRDLVMEALMRARRA